ncbi:hypothetical protein FB451DRAFT_1248905 [Mycena latifolia]|nr:hypothetical protein FB451DRAFT_1248905 [Mycena latifolia]
MKELKLSDIDSLTGLGEALGHQFFYRHGRRVSLDVVQQLCQIMSGTRYSRFARFDSEEEHHVPCHHTKASRSPKRHSIKAKVRYATCHRPAHRPTLMSSPTTHRFLLTIGNGNEAQQLLYINVIVSLEGNVHLDVRSETYSTPLPQSLVAADAGAQAHADGDAREGNLQLSLIPTSHPPGPNSIPVAAIVLPTPDPAQARLTTVSRSTMPPAYSPRTPPPAYSPATPPSAPLHVSANRAQVPLSTPTIIPANFPPPPPPSVPNFHAPHLYVQPQIRRVARPERRRFVPPPPPPPPGDGPGFLSALLTLGLEMLPQKRRADAHLGGRYTKRRRL